MTVICHDWEFFEDGETIRPISVGLAVENGDEFYAVFEDAREMCQKSQWLADHVGCHFRDPRVKLRSYKKIARDLKDFILSYKEPELWAWHGAYDHVTLAQVLGGPMINLPQGIPMVTHDIKTLQLLADEKVECAGLRRVNPPCQDASTLHHALYDARHDMELYTFYRFILGEG